MPTAAGSSLRQPVVVMGVSGSGKSTVAAAIASRLQLPYVDGDGLHSPASIAKMESGTPLQDADRWPWLDRIGACLADVVSSPRGVVVACSALKRAYRDRIRSEAPGVRFVFLDGAVDLIAARLAHRAGHYMPSALLASQLRTLERPDEEETDVLRIGIEPPPDRIAQAACAALSAAR